MEKRLEEEALVFCGSKSTTTGAIATFRGSGSAASSEAR